MCALTPQSFSQREGLRWSNRLRLKRGGRQPLWLIYTFAIYHQPERTMNTAKLFWSGRSQAVRLPKEYRFTGDQVRIRRHGSTVILEPIASDWSWLDAITGPLNEDFEQAVREQPPMEEPSGMDELFR